MTRVLDLTGETFGRLTVVARAGSTPGRVATWTCLCSCGNETVVPGRHLRTGNTRSCGCLFREEQSARIAARNGRTVVKYAGAHRRVTAAKGPVAAHPCVDCSGPAAEWSYDKADEDELRDERGRVYSLNPEHYVARCVRCHRRFDGNLPVVV